MRVTLLYVVFVVSTGTTVCARVMTVSRRYKPLGYIRGSSGVKRALYNGGLSEVDILDDEEE